MPVSSPQSLERYELLDRVAVGGMAEVFRAKAYGAHGFEKTLAIKRILPELARDPEFEERFIGEAKLAVKLTHANVVQVFDFGRTAGTLFIAMEYVDGLDLAALLKRYRDRGERVPIPAAFHTAVEIARGLDFAHQHGVIHRDVSPSNILISRAGEVKIADFGIALAADKKATDRRRIMGKWRYMSPEQTAGETLGARSDLFSAASVMFEVFTGEKLFPGDESNVIIDSIHKMEIPPASERRAGLPTRLDEVLGRALERDPTKRWEKAAEMLRALIEVSYNSSIVATALDVADAVASVLGPKEEEQAAGESGGAGGIDDLIQAQLREAEGRAVTVRKTAVGEGEGGGDGEGDGAGEREGEGEGEADRRTQTAGTMVKAGVGSDGVTVWETEETVAAGPAAKRRTGSQRAIQDEDAVERSAAGAGKRLATVAAAIGAAALAVAWGLYGFGGSEESSAPPGQEATPVATAGADAAPKGETVAILDVSSSPAGAQVEVDGKAVPGETPLQVEVRPGKSHRIRVSLEGYRTATDEVVPQPGERIRIRPPLVALRTSLTVKSRPSGATVLLDGEVIGVTPLERDDLRPGKKRRLVLRKPDHHEVAMNLDLVADGEKEVYRRLKSSVDWGQIKLRILDSGQASWANVFLGQKRLGQAPGRLRLPVGRHRLRLHNTDTGKKGSVEVVVEADRVTTYTARL